MAKPQKAAELPAANKKVRSLSIDMNGVLKLHTALQGLDAYDRPVGDKVVKEYYALGAMRLGIARNLTALQQVIEDFEKARVSLVKECEPKPGSGVKDTDPNWSRFKAEFEKMSEVKHTVKLSTIDRAKLDLEKNPIPVMVLAALDPIMVGNVDEDEEDETDQPEE